MKKSVVVDDKKLDLGTVGMLPMYINLSDVDVRGSLAVDRKTPVALSVVTAKEIEEKLSTQEFPGDIEIFAECLCHERGGSVWRWTD